MWLYIIIAYLAANINGAYITTQLQTQQDIRTLGSHNAGARNAARTGGNKAFVITIIIDALKTIIPLTIAQAASVPPGIIAGMVPAAVIGHIWPFILKGHGGKGVVVYLACALTLQWPAIAAIGLISLAAKVMKVSFSKTMLAAMAAPIIIAYIEGATVQAVAFTAGYIIVITAHIINVHPGQRTKEEHQ